MIERLNAEGAPQPKGPYSPAVRAGDFLFVSGQGPVNPVTNQFVLDSIEDQTRLTLNNIGSILTSFGFSFQDVVRCGVFLLDAADFAAMNKVYAEFFGDAKPARSTVVTGLLEPGMKVEIDCVAWCPKKA